MIEGETIQAPGGELRIVPLGGLGEIGMNCLALEQNGDVIVIDCGVTFPTTDQGVDVIHPAFDWLLERRSSVRGVVITHGHEDHIGALPYLLDDLDVPVFAPAHAMALIKARLEEHGFDVPSLPLWTLTTGERFTVGSFDFEPIRVTHSIADACALAIRTVAGLVVHTGDFKLDDGPADGELTDERRLGMLGDEGVRLLFSDSTNVDSPGKARSESSVGEALDEVVLAAEHRVVIGMFASNVQRLTLLGKVAQRARRRICLLGRSMENHVRVAREVGRLDWPSDLVVSPEIAQAMPRREVLGIATGTQGEAPAALARLASGTHNRMRLEAGDTVVFSSRIIPGNDRPVFDLYSSLLRQGVHVVSRTTNPGVHASGHAHRGELERMIELVRPSAFVPVHGTLHHLMRHAELARDMGIGDVLVAENGDVVSIRAAGRLEKVGRAPSGRVATFGGDSIPPEVLRERAQLGRSGVALVSIALRDRVLAAPPVVKTWGVLGALDHDVLVRAGRTVEHAVLDWLARHHEAGLEDEVRIAVRRVFESQIGARPIVVVSVVRS